MADFELKSDEEKAEELKAWWKQNGTSVIAGIALTIGIAIIAGLVSGKILSVTGRRETPYTDSEEFGVEN